LGSNLCVPLIGRSPRKSYFHYIIEQVSAKLAQWKANQLSFAGRVTLAKSVIEAIPIYPMMSMLLPKSCLDEIQKLQRGFIWGDNENGRKYHDVGWNNVSQSKENGGLGIRRLRLMNEACIMKLGRKLQVGSNDFWGNIEEIMIIMV
jgi:hypothetical protein